MNPESTDFCKSLEELTGLIEGDPNDAPTPLAAWIRRSWKKPLSNLSNEEIGQLIIQECGVPYVLDLVWPKLRVNPLLDGGYYPGDILSNLIRWEDRAWTERPAYKEELKSLFEQALNRPIEEKDGFLDSMGLPLDGCGPN
jgi:hypothetical protein